MNLRKRYPYTMLMPALIIFLIFFISPVITGFYYSFTDWRLIGANRPIHFVGLENFKTMFEQPRLAIGIKNTLIFTVFASIGMNVLGFAIAVLLNREFPGRNFFRMVFYMPCIFSTMVVGFLFKFILNPTNGFLNKMLESFGLDFLALNWLGDPKIAIYSTILVQIWMWTGFHVVIYLAGLQTLPSDVLEAASIDGADGWHCMRYIKMPLMLPTFNINIMLAVVGGLKVFDMVYILTNGGPGFASEVFGTLMYKAVADGNMGYASAIGLLNLIVIAIVTIPALHYSRKKEGEMF